jgi:hypothetical protein
MTDRSPPLPIRGALRTLSFIEPHEETEARDLINNEFIALTGKPFDMRVCGYMVAIKLHIRSDEIKDVDTKNGKVTLYRPQSTVDADKYQSVSGVVVGIGPQAYKGTMADGSSKYPEGPWCKVGDIVMLPRFESTPITFRGVVMAMVVDDRIQAIISDPNDVQSITMADRI